MMYKLVFTFTCTCHMENKNIIIIWVRSKKDTIVWKSGIMGKNTRIHPETISDLIYRKYRTQSRDLAKQVPLVDFTIVLPDFYKSNKRPRKIKADIIQHVMMLNLLNVEPIVHEHC